MNPGNRVFSNFSSILWRVYFAMMRCFKGFESNEINLRCDLESGMLNKSDKKINELEGH